MQAKLATSYSVNLGLNSHCLSAKNDLIDFDRFGFAFHS